MNPIERLFMTPLMRRALLLAPAVLLAIAPLTAKAQAVGPATQPTEIVPAPATQVPTDPFATRVARTPTTQISLNFKDAPIDAVLDQLSSLAGFVVVKDTPLTGRVTVLSKQPVSPEEAVTLLNAVLKTNGYTAIQAGRILTITTRDKAKKSNIPVFFGADPKQIVQSDTLITQVIPLRSVDAVKLKKDLEPLIGTDADVSSNAASNSLIITDTSTNIYRIVNIVSNLDKRDATENTIFVKQLLYADASAAAKLITDIFKTEDQTQGNQAQGPGAFFRQFQGGGGGRGGGGGGAAATEDNDKGRTGKVVASADSRTNTVVVTGPAETLKVVEDVIKQLDANPAAEQAFFYYPLKNGQSANMAAVLNNLFGNNTSSGSNRNNANTNSNNGRTSSGGTSSFGGSSFGSSGGNTRGGNTSSGSSNTSIGGTAAINRGFNTGGNVNVSSAVAGAAAQLAGQVLVVADADTNSLLVSTASKYRDQVKAIIDQLDRPVPQVLIKVLIAEVTHNNSSDLGVDFSILNTRNAGANGQSAVTLFGRPTNGLVVSVLEDNITATIHALATAGKLDVLSRPYILASDNQASLITVGQTVPIIVQSNLDVNNNPVNQIQYKDIGIILNVTPHINPDGMVIMDVAPQVSSFSDQSVPISSTVNAPVFNLRSADTRVGVKDGETIVIGGMMQDQKIETIQKVPLLGDIPLAGALFRRTQVNKSKTELLFFLTPHVAKAPDRLKSMSDDERNGLKLTPNAVQPGTYQEHLRGLDRGGDPDAKLAPETPEAPERRPSEPPLPGTK